MQFAHFFLFSLPVTELRSHHRQRETDELLSHELSSRTVRECSSVSGSDMFALSLMIEVEGSDRDDLGAT